MAHISTIFRHKECSGGMIFQQDICQVKLDQNSIIPWVNGLFPQYEIGQKVFVISKNSDSPQYSISELFIESIECRIVTWNKTPELITSRYRFNQPIDDNFNDYAEIANVFPSRQAAENEIKWTPLNLPYEVFREALGCNENGTRNEALLENCELGTCCANISYARDILISAMLNKGLIARHLHTAQEYLSKHEKPQKTANLKKITDALEMQIDWE